MSESTIPDPGELIRAKVAWAHRYAELGWKVFVLGRDKTPLPNCLECKDADWTHDRETCNHLTCHGFYAATDSLATLVMMISRYPDGWLAVRTGSASRLLVLDFEVTGLGTLDEFEQWTGVDLPPTLQQHTQSGGRHLLYRLPTGVVVKSRNRPLPDMDVKAEGGYIALPTPGDPRRVWIKNMARMRSSPLAEAPAELLTWLVKTRGGSSGGGNGTGPSVSVDGYDYHRFIRDGCPAGARDQFFNDLIFRARKTGTGRPMAEVQARYHWERCAQPPDAEWYMPWEHVQYKLDRVWQTVAPPVLPSWRPTEPTNEGAPVPKHGGIVKQERSDWRSRS